MEPLSIQNCSGPDGAVSDAEGDAPAVAGDAKHLTDDSPFMFCSRTVVSPSKKRCRGSSVSVRKLAVRKR